MWAVGLCVYAVVGWLAVGRRRATTQIISIKGRDAWSCACERGRGRSAPDPATLTTSSETATTAKDHQGMLTSLP
jgi:hypothetical protein